MNTYRSEPRRRRWVVRGVLMGLATLTAGVVGVKTMASNSTTADADPISANGTKTGYVYGESSSGCAADAAVFFTDFGQRGDDMFTVKDTCSDGLGVRVTVCEASGQERCGANIVNDGGRGSRVRGFTNMASGRQYNMSIQWFDDTGVILDEATVIIKGLGE